MQNDALEFEQRFLSLIPPSYDPRCDVKYYPASVKLKNGSWRERVILVDRPNAKKAICSLDWLEFHGTKLWNQIISIDPSSIYDVSPSRYRLNPEIVSEIHRLHGQRKFYRMLITKDDYPIYLSIDARYTGLGLFDFFVLPCGYEAKDIKKVVGYNFHKKILIKQIKEDERQNNLPSPLLEKIRDGWMPEKEAKAPEPWEMCYCIYPPISERDDYYQSTLDNGGDNVLKRDGVNSFNYHHFQESVNVCINEERERKMESSSLVHMNGSFFKSVSQGKGGPNAYEPKHIGDKLLQGLNNDDEGRYLVKATLKDGTIVDNVVLIHENRIKVENWKNPPFMSYARCKYLIDADNIRTIEPSPNSIPIEFRNRLPLESGMGRLNFGAIMNDGSIHAYAYPGYSDFIDIPSPYSTKDIKSLEAWDRLIYWAFAFYEEPIFATCVFKNDSYSPDSGGLYALREAFKRKR
jgi:hypothetical protein